MPTKSSKNNKKNDGSKVSSYYCDTSVSTNPFIKKNQDTHELTFLIWDDVPRSTGIKRNNTDYDNLNNWI